MFVESKKIFEGTKFENEWYVYHDALSLLTSKASTEYMKQKGFYSHLILPQNGLNSGTVYAHRVVGNHPEMMPLDSHLNQDVHNAVDQHAVVTKSIPWGHHLKFSKRTPKAMAKAYHRLWDPSLGIHAGVPTSKRIIQDISRIVDETYLSIVKHRGRALYGLHTCDGRRKKECGNEKGHGGKRVKKYEEDDIAWVHPDVAHLLDDLVSKYQK